MLSLTRTGSIAAVIAAARDVPARVIPYAASTALTRVAVLGQKSIIDSMPRVLDRPTRYTLGATRVVPSTVQTLAARVAVKDQAAGASGNVPENYLFPEVFGGARREKRFEKALRFAGILQRGERAILGVNAPTDASGNLQRSELTRVLKATAARPGAKRSTKAQKADKKAYFAGTVAGQRGVWKRDERKLSAVVIFTRKVPQYRQRLDFEGLARSAAQDNFEAEFSRAAQAIIQRRGG